MSGIKEAVNFVVTKLNTVTNVTAQAAANDPREHWDSVLLAKWPSEDPRILALAYPKDSTTKLETGNRIRFFHQLEISIYITKDAEALRSDTLLDAVDAIVTVLRGPEMGNVTLNKYEAIEVLQQPLAGCRIFVTMNYCGGN